MKIPINKIICGDALEVLRTMPDEFVHCVVTSPPYWGLRDYGVSGQIGLEKTPEEYVAKLVEIFREVRRVLRKDGTLWLNIGDCYCGSGQGWGQDPESISKLQGGNVGSLHSLDKQPVGYHIRGLKPKDLIGIPWRVAFALQADGWWLRCDVIWHKPNPMPESVRDRPTKAHEYVFLLTKSARYYYDQEAIRESAQDHGIRDRSNWSARINAESYGQKPHMGGENGNYADRGRNARSVWTIATQAFPEAHFATFPEKLVERCVKAGTSEKGCCPKCGAGWVRIIKKARTFESGSGKTGKIPVGKNPGGVQGGGETKDIRMGPCIKTTTTHWAPICRCLCKDIMASVIRRTNTNRGALIKNGEPKTICEALGITDPAIVLDPFIGSGRTAIVAKKLGRNFIGIELNPKYVEMANRCIAEAMPFFETQESNDNKIL